MLDPLHRQLASALTLQGGCLCVLDYDMKLVGEPCGMHRALAAYELREVAELAAGEKEKLDGQ